MASVDSLIRDGGRGVDLRRVVATVSALISGQALVRIGSLLIVPLFLHRWSPAEYGEWLTLSAVAGYLALADPAIHLAAVNELTRLHSLGDVKGFQRVLASSLTAYVVLASLGTAALVGA